MAIKASQTEQTRDVRTRELHERIAPPAEYWLPAELQLMDVTLGQSVSVSHFGGPWGESKAKRRHHRLMGTRENVGTRTISAYVRDERERLYNGTWAKFCFDVPSDFNDGLAYFGPHPARALFRSSASMAMDPRDGRVRKVDRSTTAQDARWSSNRIGTGRGALRLQSSGFNIFTRSAMVSGTTGLTAISPGGAPSTISVDSTLPQLFDFTDAPGGGPWTAQKLVITAAAAAPTGGGARWPASRVIPAAQPYQVAIDYSCDPTAPLFWRLQETGGGSGQWWNDSTGAFQVGSVDNALPTSTTITRFFSKIITATNAAGVTATLEIIQQTGGTVSRKNYVYHVQANNVPWIIGYLPQDTNASTDPMPFGFQSVDVFGFSNDSVRGRGRIVNNNRGTFYLRFIPYWNSADVVASAAPGVGYDFVVLDLKYAASAVASIDNTIRVQYQGLNSRWHVAITSAGAPVNLYVTDAVVRGEEICLAVRWASLTSDAGELDDKYGTAGASRNWDFGVSRNGGAIVSGNTTSPVPVEQSISYGEIGGAANSAGLASLNGDLIEYAFLPYVLTDEERDALLRQPNTAWTT